MVTPSELLTGAADLIRDTAAKATPGPWFTHDTHLNRGGHAATVLSGTYPEGQLRAWLPTWSHEPWDETRNAWNDARWIALLSPAVAPHLERWLTEVWKHVKVKGYREDCWTCKPAVEFARVILGEDQP